MSVIDASSLLRPDLLHGLSMLLAGASSKGHGQSPAGSVASACAGLGARVCECELAVDGSPGAPQQDLLERAARDAITRAQAHAGALELLVIDAASVFSRAHEDGREARSAPAPAPAHAPAPAPAPARDALRACLDTSWNVTREVAERAFLAEPRGGRVIYVAPRPDAGEHADAARAGLENLARTLSIEWARHGVTAVAIAPGAASADEVAALTAYLASPAGAYFSGCLLDLRGPAGVG